jgi:uncharacterized membrane protein (UPF0136 family)
MLGGGVMGYKSAGSKASLYSGGASALLLLVAFLLSLSSPVAGLWMGAIVTILLCITFAARLAKTARFMPSGMLLALSVVALLILTWAALGAQGKLGPTETLEINERS